MNPPPTVINFAYGSNLLVARIRERVPSAQPLAVARLHGYRLAWHKRGRDGSGKCDIVATGEPLDCVWGVAYAIDARERPLLDAAEGLGHGYEHHPVRVLAAIGTMDAFAYRAIDIDTSLAPFDWYHGLVTAGALAHGLPAGYRARLAAQPVMADPDHARVAHHRRLIGL
ncbi:MAG: gamma-glutamylcyclotransferase [Burkholderiaceae bacterium]|nr:gamma-glutamylcyclotransferase [Burkholderiaceae bacterium]